jgi:hypothetical protein
MAMIPDSNSDLYAATYNGSSWVVTNAGVGLETNLSSIDSVSFGVAIRPIPRPDHMAVTSTEGTATTGGTEVLTSSW